MKNTNKLPKIKKRIQFFFLIPFFILIFFFFLFFQSFIISQEMTIAKKHIGYIEKVDVAIVNLLISAQLENYYISKEVSRLIQRGDQKELLNYLVVAEKKQEKLAILDSDIMLVIDQDRNIIARSERIKEKRYELMHEGDLKYGWNPSLGFEQAFSNALAGEVDVRKIIYDRDFLRREHYDIWKADGMGLTIMTPIIDKKEDKQIGVLITITFLNNNTSIISGIKVLTDVSFTAILPTGKPIGSFFISESVEKIAVCPTIAIAAKKRLEKIATGELKKTTKNFILEDFTIEEIELTHHTGTSRWYRVVYWIEWDPEENFVSFRGIAMEVDIHRENRDFLIKLILAIAFSQLFLFFISYFYIKIRLIHPIISFVAQLKKKKGYEKIKISQYYQEFKELEDAFNLSFSQVKEARGVLEIKIAARTEQLEELSKGLETQVLIKTNELQEKIDKLEQHVKVVIDRELKMINLKKEIKKLKEDKNN